MANQRSALDGAEVRADSSATELLRRSLPGASVSTPCTDLPLSLSFCICASCLCSGGSFGATCCAAARRMSSHAGAAVLSAVPLVHHSFCAVSLSGSQRQCHVLHTGNTVQCVMPLWPPAVCSRSCCLCLRHTVQKLLQGLCVIFQQQILTRSRLAQLLLVCRFWTSSHRLPSGAQWAL